MFVLSMFKMNVNPLRSWCFYSVQESALRTLPWCERRFIVCLFELMLYVLLCRDVNNLTKMTKLIKTLYVAHYENAIFSEEEKQSIFFIMSHIFFTYVCIKENYGVLSIYFLMAWLISG